MCYGTLKSLRSVNGEALHVLHVIVELLERKNNQNWYTYSVCNMKRCQSKQAKIYELE